MEIDRALLKGTISLLLLNLLARGEMYGSKILQSASIRSEKAFEFKEGTLYAALQLLEKKGLVRSKWRTGDNGRERKFYSLTTKGQKAAQEHERQRQQLTRAINAVLASK